MCVYMISYTYRCILMYILVCVKEKERDLIVNEIYIN